MARKQTRKAYKLEIRRRKRGRSRREREDRGMGTVRREGKGFPRR